MCDHREAMPRSVRVQPPLAACHVPRVQRGHRSRLLGRRSRHGATRGNLVLPAHPAPAAPDSSFQAGEPHRGLNASKGSARSKARGNPPAAGCAHRCSSPCPPRLAGEHGGRPPCLGGSRGDYQGSPLAILPRCFAELPRNGMISHQNPSLSSASYSSPGDLLKSGGRRR